MTKIAELQNSTSVLAKLTSTQRSKGFCAFEPPDVSSDMQVKLLI